MSEPDRGHHRQTSTSRLVQLFRPRTAGLVTQIVETIQKQVDPYGPTNSGRRRQLIEKAVGNAISEFLQMVEASSDIGRRADELFRRMGHGEAMDGHPLETMQAAFRIATQESWDYLRDFALEQQLSTEALARLGDTLFAHIDHLAEQSRLGHAGGVRARERDPARAAVQLLASLLDDGDPSTVKHQAVLTGWDVPNETIVLSIQTQPGTTLDPGKLAGRCLTGSDPVVKDPGHQVLLVSAEHGAAVLAHLEKESAVTRAAYSEPVQSHGIPDAYRWTTRALHLASRGVIPGQRIIRCEDHRTQIWLHAEPRLRQRLCQELLAPLFSESPNSREILSETLLVWLETRNSAPAIAATLGVHPQTVRYRWKRINELFGDDLQDPEFIVVLTMLLKASVPLWVAGDQSDFEDFHAGTDR